MWFGCSNSTGPTTPLEENDDGNIFLGNYTTKSDTLVVITPMSIETRRECRGDTMVSVVDTNEADTVGVAYNLSGNTLTLTDTSKVDSNDILKYVLERDGAGNGLVGAWKIDRIEKGSGEVIEIQNNSLLDSTEIPYDQIRIHILSNGKMEISGVDLSQMEAAFNIMGWKIGWGIIGWMYDITMADTVIDDKPGVVLTGNKSGEVVTILWNKEGDATYRSSNPDHQPHTVYENPASCPNDPPQWYGDFFGDNGVLGKRSDVDMYASHNKEKCSENNTWLYRLLQDL